MEDEWNIKGKHPTLGAEPRELLDVIIDSGEVLGLDGVEVRY
jgi:hypothetical protein